MREIRNICICGGGGLGLVCAGVFLSKGIEVNLLTGHPKNWNKEIVVFDPEGKTYGGKLGIVTSNAGEVIPKADMIFLTLPGFLIEKVLKEIKPFIGEGTVIGSVVSSTGFFFAAHNILTKRNPLFGFQRVPYIARQRQYGSIGDLLGYKSCLNVAIENCSHPIELISKLQWIFGTKINLLDNFYEVSLTNSNPILHTGRLYSMWKDYDGEVYPERPLFYSDWTDEASEYLIKMDEEFQLLLKRLAIKESVITTLLQYYESENAQSLTQKIKSIPAFKTIQSPMLEKNDGWVPDFNSRYFTEDFPYGLRFIRDLAKKNSIKTPTIDKVYNWGISKIAN